jgi:hypothetical protein
MAGIAVRRTASLRAAYVPAIHVLFSNSICRQDVDARHKAGHDDYCCERAALEPHGLNSSG